MQPLEVVLFGGFALRRGGDTVPPVPSRIGRSLFAYLVVNRGIPHMRERLVAEFWPDLPESRGRRRLSHTLWQLQDALSELPGGTPYLEVATDSLSFASDAPVRVDVDEFEQGLEELRQLGADDTIRARDLGRLQRAIDLYRGEFLDGHYEDWVMAEQERLGQRYLEALSLLVGLAKRFGAYDDALVYARRLTNQAPLREDAHREVMRLSMLLGRPAEAIKQFERCAEVLADELGADPAAATVQLHDRIVRQQRIGSGTSAEPVASGPFPQRPPLVGRDRERQAVLNVLEGSVAGRGGAVLLEGQPGLGKTRLTEEIIEDAEWRGFTVLTTTCLGTEGQGAFTAVQSLLSNTLTPLVVERLRHRVEPVWLAQVARLVPILHRVLPGDTPQPSDLPRAEGAQRMRDALVRVLLALSDIDPTLAIVDDAQWADDESLEVLAAVAAELPTHPFVLFLGYRTDEARARPAVWNTVQRIDRIARPTRLLLRPLDPFSVGELIRTVARGHHVDPLAISRLQRETGGNPLFVVETLRELAQRDGLSDLASDDPSQIPLPGSIRELVLGQFDRLPNGIRFVLDAAAVAGDGTDLDTLATAVDLPRSTVVEAVDLLVRRNLLRELDDGYGLPHDQVRRTSVDAMEPAARRSLHRRFGAALEQYHPDDVERLAHHFEAGGASRQAVRYLQAAGRKAVSFHAYSTADGFYRRASAQQSSGPVSVVARFGLLAEHEDVLDVLGERQRQHEVIAEMETLTGGDPVRTTEVTRRRAILAAELGDLAEASDLADRAVGVAERLQDGQLHGRALQAAASIRSWMGRREEAVDFWERAIALDPAPGVRAESRTMLASVLRELHRHDEAVAHLTVALNIAEEFGERREEARALSVLGLVHMETGDSARAAELYRRSLSTCEAIGFRRGEAINLMNIANVLYASNDVSRSLDAYERAGEIFASLGDPRGLALVRMNQGFVRHVLVGDDVRAKADIDRALRYFEETDDLPRQAGCRDTLAAIAIGGGKLAQAEGQIERALQLLAGQDEFRTEVQLLQRRTELLLAEGHVDRAVADIEAARRMADDHRLAELIPGVDAWLGRARLSQGDVRAALAATTSAVDALQEDAEHAHLIRLAHHDALVANGRHAEALEHARRGAAEVTAMLDELDPVLREMAAAREPHARLLSLAGTPSPSRVTLSVASQAAPRGRALRSAELTEVRVDLDVTEAPVDPVERRRWLLGRIVGQILDQGGAPTVADLATVLEVSEATVRRDLAALRGQGRHLPTRGARAG